jgi:hypothetical protein
MVPDLALAHERRRRAASYARRQRRFRARAEKWGSRAQRALNLGGLAFLTAAVAALAVLLGEAPPIALSGVGLALGASAAWIARHARCEEAAQAAWRWCAVNERGERRCRDDWRDFSDDGSEFVDPEHAHSSDLEVFGAGSLFQFLNVAHTRQGRRTLARFLTETVSNPSALDEIQARQAAVRCLVPQLSLRQRLETLTIAPPLGSERSRAPVRPPPAARSDDEALLEWAESAPRFLPRSAVLWTARVLPVLSLTACVASELFGISSWLWKAGVLLQALLVFHTRRDVARLAGAVSRWQGAFGRRARAFRLLEERRLEAPLLQRLQDGIRGGGRRASGELERLDRILGWLALRNSEWAHPPINVLSCWDIHCVVALERWQREAGKRLQGWLEALGRVEALCSLSGAAYDNPEFTFPELAAGPAQLVATGIGHPLLSPDMRVDNDVCLPAPGRALLVTGSNMSGKSTLLRAVGLGSVMAFAGGPVCARRLRLGPLSLHTSLRVNDSLSEGVSRFYAELRRLQTMLLASRGNTPVLFLIDEILAATNSVERGIGARWILAELLRAGALGAISTHDSGLCQLPAAFMERVEQVHFRESVVDGKLVFDYRLHAGPVHEGNALRLMRSLGLAIP